MHLAPQVPGVSVCPARENELRCAGRTISAAAWGAQWVLMLKPNVGEAVWWQVPSRPVSHGMMSQQDSNSSWITVPEEAWVTPGLLSAALWCAEAVLLPGCERRLWQDIGDTT